MGPRQKCVLLATAVALTLPITPVLAQEESPTVPATIEPTPEPTTPATTEVPTVAPEQRPLISGKRLNGLLTLVVIFGIALLALMVFRKLGDEAHSRPVIAGMVLVMVVVAVIILGVSGKITEEGLSAILAAIVGYAAGRTTPETRPPADTRLPEGNRAEGKSAEV